MDSPDTNLKEQLELATEILSDRGMTTAAAYRLAELVVAFNGWWNLQRSAWKPRGTGEVALATLWFSVITPSVSMEWELPEDRDRWTANHRKLYQQLMDLAERHRTSIHASTYPLL